MSLMFSNRASLAAVLCILTLHSGLVSAQSGQGKRRGPPPEAIAACADAQQGDSCSFTGREEEELSGTCFEPPHEGDELACAPEGHQPPEHQQED